MVAGRNPFLFLKHRFHILHFPNSTGFFTKPTSCHHTKYQLSPDIAPEFARRQSVMNGYDNPNRPIGVGLVLLQPAPELAGEEVVGLSLWASSTLLLPELVTLCSLTWIWQQPIQWQRLSCPWNLQWSFFRSQLLLLELYSWWKSLCPQEIGVGIRSLSIANYIHVI